MSATRFQLTKQGGPFEKASVPLPIPDADEVVVRIKAIGLNPLDWKQRDFGIMIPSYPFVLGVDGAGVVKAVGSAVQDFKIGDAVFGTVGLSNRAGGYQEAVAVPAFQLAKKPAEITFEQAATLPICYLTAVSLITAGLQVSLPHLNPNGTNSIKSVLVVGGSSAVGAHAIQLLRLALPDAVILATSSARHHSRLLDLGASKVLDRSAQADASIVRAATPGGKGVDAVLDAVSTAGDQGSIFETLSKDGPRLYTYPMASQPYQIPEGIDGSLLMGRKIFELEGGRGAMPGLAQLFESGRYKLPLPVETSVGFDSIPSLLDRIKAGTSGIKFAVSV